jgi:hypothetical protein
MGTENGMGANGDAGSLDIGSPSTSFGAFNAADPVQAPRGDNLALIRDYPSCVGNVDLKVHLKQVAPSEIRTVPTKVNVDDLPSGPAVTLGAMFESVQASCLFSPKAPASVATPTLDYLKTGRPLVGR